MTIEYQDVGQALVSLTPYSSIVFNQLHAELLRQQINGSWHAFPFQ